MVWQMAGTWKEHDWKIDNKEIWARSVWIDLSKWIQTVKISVSHVNAYHR